MNTNADTGASAQGEAGDAPKRRGTREARRPPCETQAAKPPRSGRHSVSAELPAKPYERTPSERRAVEAYRAARRDKPDVPRLKVVEDSGHPTVMPDHPDLETGVVLLMQALGTQNSDFALTVITLFANAVSKGATVDEVGMNFMLAVVTGIEPRDQLEAMLAAQMAATHMQVMTFARRLKHVENIPQQDSAERAFNKLARTFAAQIEALKRYRSVGVQTVRVEHVTVNEGGQAIVGNVATGGRGLPQKPEATP